MHVVYVLQHQHLLDGDREDTKFCGVYSTRDRAVEAVERLIQQPGFKNFPEICTPDNDCEEGFYIDPYEIDEDHWTLGFVTLVSTSSCD